GESELERSFRVARKTADGWEVVAEGPSGREPAQLLRGPDDRLYVLCWPEGAPRLWVSDAGGANFAPAAVPGNWDAPNHWPYFSTGMAPDGTLYLLRSGGGKPGYFKWASRDATTGLWGAVHRVDIDYRYAYTYLLPTAEHGGYLASLRDVIWADLGYSQPAGAFDYCFNAVKSWYSPDPAEQPFTETLVREELPTGQYARPNISLNYHGDAYVDNHGRSHILCPVQGGSTGGARRLIHYIYDGSDLIKLMTLPTSITNGRLIQNAAGKFFLLTFREATLYVYPAADANGLQLEAPVTLSLQGHAVRYSNLHLAAPRTGTPLADRVDVVYPAGESAEQWIYFQLQLPPEGPADTTLLPVPALKIFPNPVHDLLFLRGLGEDAGVVVFNLAGQVIWRRTGLYEEVQIDTSAWPAGIYLLWVDTTQGLVMRKLVRQ
ncbi:MAG: T9SS type A sorting domain-containing protein, partial [Lewinella sp.]|nr:T9SS type A sorting domain-containing protein [Lewinella sp.]